MINKARETLILADSSKFGTRSLQQITDLNANVSIFTELRPDQQMLDTIERNEAKLFICDDTSILKKDKFDE